MLAHVFTDLYGQGAGLLAYYDLDERQERLFHRLAAGVANFELKIEVDSKPVTDEELKSFNDVFVILRRVHPEFFWVGERASSGIVGGKAWVWPVYHIDATEISATIENGKVIYPSADYVSRAKAIVDSRQAAIREKIAGLPLHSGMSPYERELAAHDWLYDHVAYDNESPNKNNIYGALIEGSANCQGISRAFQHILGLSGTECLLLGGDFLSDGKAGQHMWNAVRLDGEWYQVDVTSNITGGKRNGLPRYHTYFNRADELMTRHTVDKADAEPTITCRATAYDFYRKSGLHIVSDEDFIDKMPALITKARTNGDTMIELEFSAHYADADEIYRKMKLIDAGYATGIMFLVGELKGIVVGIIEN